MATSKYIFFTVAKRNFYSCDFFFLLFFFIMKKKFFLGVSQVATCISEKKLGKVANFSNFFWFYHFSFLP